MLRRRISLIAIFTSLISITAMSASANGASTEGSSGENCVFDEASLAPPLTDVEIADPTLVPQSFSWFTTEAAQRGLANLQEAVDEDPVDSLMGWYPNFETRSVVISLQRALNEKDQLQLTQTVSEALGGALPFTTRESCLTVETSQQLREGLQSIRDISPEVPIAWGYQPASGRIEISVETKLLDPNALDRIRGLGEGAFVTESPGLSRTTRNVDSSPHYGGALIRSADGRCTSGFVVANATGKWATSAGHCASGNNVSIANGGTGNYGRTAGRSFPDPDIMRIGASSETYTNVIYTDPGIPATRTVTSRTRNSGGPFCLSGVFSRAVCGAVMVDNDASFCDESGCTYHLYRVETYDQSRIITQGGDSGGPVYYPTGTEGADARGSIVAGSRTGSYYSFIHNIGSIENALGSSIVTTCCAASSF